MNGEIQRHGSVIVVPHPEDETKPFSERRYLIIRRSERVAAPGKLCFPGGGIESGETPEQAARREFREEVGGEITDLCPIWENVTPWCVHLRWFSGKLTSPITALTPAPAEVSSILWLNIESLLDAPDTLASNTPFLTGLLNGTIVLPQSKKTEG